MPPSIVIVSASVGTGHNQAARALVESLAVAAPHVKVEVLDAMQHVPRPFRMYYAGGFVLSMTHFQRAYGLGFKFTDRYQGSDRTLSERARLAIESRCLRPLTDKLLARRPSLILHTHFLAGPACARLIRSGQLTCPQVIVATDVELHRWWYSEEMSHWFVPSDYSTQRPLTWGVPEGRITVSGIPICRKWTQSVDTQRVYREWDLPADRKIVLLSGGAEFTVGPIAHISRQIVQRFPQACLVVLGGRNKKLLAQLAQLGLDTQRFKIVGFTDRMHELLTVADLMITKAGGITTAECLAKGRPMVFIRPVPGQEGNNALYFQRQGAGIVTGTTDEIIAAVAALLESPDRMDRMSQAARSLYRPASEIITNHVLKMLGVPAAAVGRAGSCTPGT